MNRTLRNARKRARRERQLTAGARKEVMRKRKLHRNRMKARKAAIARFKGAAQ